MSRETVMVKEKKSVVEKIRQKYNNPNLSEKDAKKIATLEVTNKILTGATAVAGIITVIDLFVPDPVLGFDEVALTALTGLLGGASAFVDNKIDKIAKEENADIQMEEVTKLSGQLADAAAKAKDSRARVAAAKANR